MSRRNLLRMMGVGAASAALPTWLPRLAAQGTVNTELAGDIVIWDRAGDLFQVIDAAIPAFNQVYPNIRVDHQAVETSRLAPTLVAGVNVPDGAFIEDESLGLISQHLADITDRMTPHLNDLVAYKVRVGTFDGQIKAIPYDVDPAMLFHRPDILEANGIDVASIATYDDLLRVSVDLKSANPNMKPIHIDTTPAIIVLWISMLANQQNTSLIDANGELLLETEPFLKIMNFIKTAIDEGVANLSGFASTDDIAACDQGIQVFYPWAIWFNYQVDALLKDSRGLWRATKLPKWTEDGAQAASMGGSSFVIPAASANQDLSWAFYEYMMLSLDGVRAAFGPNAIYPGGITTIIPSYKPAYAEQLMAPPESLGGQDLYGFATSMVDEIPQDYYFPLWYGQLGDILGANVQRLQAGELSPEDVLSVSAEEIRSNLMR
ncbi:MAG: extracellular solute-binding protein [Chloroflexi bacterium]|nr:extracellular solute-binding protein [Chloroflexota bacterium]